MMANSAAPVQPVGFFHHGKTGRSVPWQVWVVALLLGLEGVGNILEIPDNSQAAGWLAFKVVSVVGLIRGWRWVYGVTLVVGCLHVLGFAQTNLVAAGLNLVLVGLIASTKRYFFPKRGESVMIATGKPVGGDPEL